MLASVNAMVVRLQVKTWVILFKQSKALIASIDTLYEIRMSYARIFIEFILDPVLTALTKNSFEEMFSREVTLYVSQY